MVLSHLSCKVGGILYSCYCSPPALISVNETIQKKRKTLDLLLKWHLFS